MKKLFLFVLLLFAIPFVHSAIDVGYNINDLFSEGVLIKVPEGVVITNYSIIGVNSSDYWDDLDVPSDIAESIWWFNQTASLDYQGFYSTYNVTYQQYMSINWTELTFNAYDYRWYQQAQATNPFNQSLNTSDSVTFNSVTANYFIGDGSQLTNINHSLNTYEETYYVDVSSGSGTNVTLTTYDYVIKQFIVTPVTLTNQYRFEATEYTSNLVIERDRVQHTGEWNILKWYAIENDNIRLNISSASIDETFTIKIRYIK